MRRNTIQPLRCGCVVLRAVGDEATASRVTRAGPNLALELDGDLRFHAAAIEPPNAVSDRIGAPR